MRAATATTISTLSSRADLLRDELIRDLRSWLLGELHIGRLEPAAKLPSIRQQARDQGIDHRLMADAYRRLEDEGLVEIRGRSGVYVARRQPARDHDSAEGRWLTGALAAAWQHNFDAARAARVLDLASSNRIRCACFESTEDHLDACCTELRQRFGMNVDPVRMLGPGETGALAERARIRRKLGDVQVAVTTAFHAPVVRPLAEAARVPLLVVSLHDRFRELLRERMQEGMTVVIADPAYADRARHYFSTEIGVGRLRIVLASDPRAATLESGPDVLFTSAALRRLGRGGNHLLSGLPFFSDEFTARLAALVVGIGTWGALGGGIEGGPPSS